MGKYKLKFKPYGQSAVLIEWPQIISEEILSDICNFSLCIENNKIKHIVEINFIYSSLLILYNNSKISCKDISERLKLLYENHNEIHKFEFNHWEIPVCYEQNFGIDLIELSLEKNISVEEIISLHTTELYTVYGLGFLPGFLYLGGLNSMLFSPRKNIPRLNVAKGSVAIGNEQTGIYPQNSPGGWKIIGKTPLKLFSIENNPPSVIQPGDKISFKTISLEEFIEIEGTILDFNYKKQ